MSVPGPGSFDTLGMTEEEMEAYVEELLMEQAVEAAAAENRSLEEELEGTVYAAVRSTSSFAIKLIAANNAYLARHLLDLGVLRSGDGTSVVSDESNP
jgi:hypothetical protein